MTKDYYDFITERLRYKADRFYGIAAHLSLGRGLVYKGIRYPVYVDEECRFKTVEGIVYVLTHECDVSAQNVRSFNEDILICPLIPFEFFVEKFLSEAGGDDKLRPYLKNLGSGRMSRLMYFPKINGYCNFGSIMFLNQMCATNLRVFGLESAERIAALGPVGAHEVERVLREHLLRPKDEMLTSLVVH
jgi:hypothetical protein